MSVLTSGFGSSQQAEYQISRSLRFNSADSAYLTRTPSVAGNRRTWTWSGWVKRSGLGFQQAFFSGGTPDNADFFVSFESDNTLRLIALSGGTPILQRKTSQVFRDLSSWYHIVCAIDTTQATATSRVALYVNGSQVTAFGTETTPAQNTEFTVNATQIHGIGYRAASGGFAYFSGYLADIHFIDGQALTPSSFGEFDSVTGVWKPKKYTGTYGTNGFYLNFSDNSATTSTTLGKDSSGNNNNWTPNNFSVTAGAGNDSMVDTPTPYGTDTGIGGEVRGNYATLNPLYYLNTSFTLSNCNLQWTTTAAGIGSIFSTIGISTGKWYWEVLGSSVPTGGFGVGVAKNNSIVYGAGQVLYTSYNGLIYVDGLSSSYGATWATGDTIGVAYNADAGIITFYKNNVSQGSVTLSGYAGLTVYPVLTDGSGNALSLTINFGQQPFAYTAPSGFKAFCTTNLPEPTIKKGADHFNTVTYTGNGGTNSITGVGFSPGFTWIKSRSAATDHALYDTVRGATKQLESNLDFSETTESTGLTSFDSSGFTVGSLAQLNTSSATYVGWNWKGGGTAVTNTQGTITSQVSANPSAGFSVVSFSLLVNGSQTVGHGLNIAPSMYVTKGLTSSGIQTKSWLLYHKSLGATKFLALNANWSESTNSTVWDNIEPTSAVFRIGSGYTQANYGTSHIAYCFAEIPGYSAFGSYTGNGSADGPFVYTGFRPRFILLKVTNTTGNWTILDAAREGYNVDNDPLYPNLSDAEGTTDLLDILSNGFKLRTTDASVNGNTNTYIYAAFAENSSKYALAR